jgi:hypothetical protein
MGVFTVSVKRQFNSFFSMDMLSAIWTDRYPYVKCLLIQEKLNQPVDYMAAQKDPGNGGRKTKPIG